MAAYDDLNVKRIFIVGIASIVVTAVTALAVQVLYYYLDDLQQARTSEMGSYTRENSALNSQIAEITEPQGVNAATGNLTIPIENAMSVIISESETVEKGGSDET
ncbi:MAG: hypothetical protein CMM01_11680 [Rhodopirellula sp.]|nr:hypothetical protein [Rhodopirellula sp.]OUX51208.1 MAG: hypothetical protein CBE43_04485 [Rhodopirellula sp. TMED283]